MWGRRRLPEDEGQRLEHSEPCRAPDCTENGAQGVGGAM